MNFSCFAKKSPERVFLSGLLEAFVAGSQISAHHASAPEANQPQPKK
jgi:hypothetical protein